MPNDDDLTSAPPPAPAPQTCPQCGGELGPAAEGKAACPYCGASFGADDLGGPKAPEPEESPEELYRRGREAFAQQDYARAYESFDRITDAAPEEYEAWLEKGLAGAFRELAEEGRLDADEALLRVQKALEKYRGDNQEKFEKWAADRVGAAALDLYEEAIQRGADNQATVQGILDLLFFWETSGSEETAAWKAIVRVAEQTSTPEGTRPFDAVATRYKEKIRKHEEAEVKAKAEAESKAKAEAAGEEVEVAAAPSRKSGRTAAIIIGIVAGVAILCVLCFVILAIIGSVS